MEGIFRSNKKIIRKHFSAPLSQTLTQKHKFQSYWFIQIYKYDNRIQKYFIPIIRHLKNSFCIKKVWDNRLCTFKLLFNKSCEISYLSYSFYTFVINKDENRVEK